MAINSTRSLQHSVNLGSLLFPPVNISIAPQWTNDDSLSLFTCRSSSLNVAFIHFLKESLPRPEAPSASFKGQLINSSSSALQFTSLFTKWAFYPYVAISIRNLYSFDPSSGIESFESSPEGKMEDKDVCMLLLWATILYTRKIKRSFLRRNILDKENLEEHYYSLH